MRRRDDQSLARVVGRRYWGEVEGRRVVAAWRRSGESQSRFAARHRIHPKRLSWWIARLKRGQVTAPPGGMRFHRVRVVDALRGAAPVEPIEIVLADGAVVRVPAGCPLGELRGVLVALGRGQSDQ